MKAILVDDEPEIIEHMNRHITQISEISETVSFTEPEDALEYTRRRRVDVAFLDIEMRGMNGINLAKRMKEIRPEVNIIFVTGHDNYALDAFRVHASDYLLKPVTLDSIKTALENLRCPVRPSEKCVRIQTFGNFEIFVDDKPLQISRSKVKEMLACLVDRRGASMTAAQLASVLWEDKDYTRPVQKQTQTVISQMMKTLKEADIPYIIIKSWNNLAVDINKVDCDYYQFLDGHSAAINSYCGEYMNEYSWAEITAAMLTYKK